MPAYDEQWLGALLPGAARALDVDLGGPAIPLPANRAVCVVIVDGLGAVPFGESLAHAPFLRGLADHRAPLRSGVPSTTATSMASFGTGLPPGRHGLVGYQVLDPDRGVLLNELRWDPATDPIRWQPYPPVFTRLAEAGVRVTRVGKPGFEASGLTLAAHRGGEFIGARSLARRVDAAVAALDPAEDGRPGLVYLYWGELDTAGHEHGWQSARWTSELRRIDRQLARLARQLPAGATLVVTADHGMVDVRQDQRLDLAEHPELDGGIRLLGGEGRLVQAYCEAGASREVARRLRHAVGDRAWVRTREEAIAEGWFGPVDDRVRPRLGDVLVAAAAPFVLVDSRVASPGVLRLVGQHGSLTDAEQLVPLLVLQT